jgi:hypothetical protein
MSERLVLKKYPSGCGGSHFSGGVTEMQQFSGRNNRRQRSIRSNKTGFLVAITQ